MDVRNAPPERQLNVRVQNLFVTMNEPLNTWAIFLVHPDLDHEPQLRNRIFCILVASLAEAAAEAENRILALDREAGRLSLEAARKHLVFARAYCDGIAHVLSVFRDEEMFALHRWRNMYTHGRLTATFQERYTVHAIKDGAVISRKVDRTIYLDGTIKTVQAYQGPDSFLTTMRARFTHRVSFFWHLALSMRLPDFIPLVIRELDEQRTDLIQVVLAEGDFAATHALFERRGDELFSLITVREKLLGAEARVPDPVFFDPKASSA